MKRFILIFTLLLLCLPLLAGISLAQSKNKIEAASDFASPEHSESFNDLNMDQSNNEDDYWDEDDEDYLDEYDDEGSVTASADPFKPWNMAMFHFNDKLYFWILKPVSRGYAKVMPEVARQGILNFFSNLEAPVLFFNCLLQGKGSDAEATFARFYVNTTIGFLGFCDPASNFSKLKKSDEDFGQTLGYWGLGNGWYITWPVFGPSTMRDSIGLVGDMFLKPTFYIKAFELSAGVSTLEMVNATSFRIGDYETIKDAALDPYEALRDGYLQLREKKVTQ